MDRYGQVEPEQGIHVVAVVICSLMYYVNYVVDSRII